MTNLNAVQNKINKLIGDIDLNTNSKEELSKLELLSNLQKNILTFKNKVA